MDDQEINVGIMCAGKTSAVKHFGGGQAHISAHFLQLEMKLRTIIGNHSWQCSVSIFLGWNAQKNYYEIALVVK